MIRLIETYGYLSWYKVNISKTQIFALNYTLREIQESLNLNWNLKGIHYLGVTITKELSKLYCENYKINQEIQKDIEWSTLMLD